MIERPSLCWLALVGGLASCASRDQTTADDAGGPLPCARHTDVPCSGADAGDVADVGADVATEAAIDRAPVVLAAQQGDVRHLASDGKTVYWIRGSAILACTAGGCGGAPQTFVTEGDAGLGGLALDARHVYYTVFAYAGPVKYCPLGDCSRGARQVTLGYDHPLALAATAGGTLAWQAAGLVLVCSVPLCQERLLASGQPAGAIALDPLSVYWTADAGILACPQSGSCSGTADAAAPEVVPESAAAVALAADPSGVYWTNLGGAVMRWTPDAGAPATLATDPYRPGSLALDGVRVYWANENGQLSSCPIGGCAGAPAVVATIDGASPIAVAVDSANAYFSTTDGRIVQVAKY